MDSPNHPRDHLNLVVIHLFDGVMAWLQLIKGLSSIDKIIF